MAITVGSNPTVFGQPILGTPLKSFLDLTASYNALPGDLGRILTNYGASGSVTITLPVTANIPDGWWCDVYVMADQTVIVASPTADTLITFNDAAADSVSFGTSGEKLGGAFRFTWHATSALWICQTMAEETQTVTVVT